MKSELEKLDDTELEGLLLKLRDERDRLKRAQKEILAELERRHRKALADKFKRAAEELGRGS